MKYLLYLSLSMLGIIAAVIGCSPVNFTQGAGACSVSQPCLTANGSSQVQQDLTFTSTNKVDILIVDDNSASMNVEQTNFANYVSNTVSTLNAAGFDWQIGVTTTDVCPQNAPAGFCPSGDSGANGQLIGPSGASPAFGNQYIINANGYVGSPGGNPTTLLQNIIYRTETGSGDERGIYALNQAVNQSSGANSGFFRSGANLAVIILSDEDERSVGGVCTPPDPSNPSVCDPAYAPLETNDLAQTFINNVTTTFGGTKNMIVNSIIIQPGDTNCMAIQKAQPPAYTAHWGSTYQGLSQATNGQVGSICNDSSSNFGTMLQNITGAIVNMPASNIMTLNYIPSANPTVTFIPAANAVSWTWTPGTNQISFAVRPANGTDVHVVYDFLPTAQSNKQNNMSQSRATDESALGLSNGAHD